jgi:hypothetical protein
MRATATSEWPGAAREAREAAPPNRPQACRARLARRASARPTRPARPTRSTCWMKIKNAFLWTMATFLVLGLSIGVAYGELAARARLRRLWRL